MMYQVVLRVGKGDKKDNRVASCNKSTSDRIHSICWVHKSPPYCTAASRRSASLEWERIVMLYWNTLGRLYDIVSVSNSPCANMTLLTP